MPEPMRVVLGAAEVMRVGRIVPDWDVVGPVAVPVGIALLIGVAVWWGLLALSRRVRDRDSSRARVTRVISVPLAFALPMLFLVFALHATPLEGRVLAVMLHALGVGIVLCITWLLVRIVGAIEALIVRRYPIEVSDNLIARRVQTQTRVLSRVVMGVVILLGASVVLLTFPVVRQIGTALLASAGILGLVAGIAAKPVFGNLIAGLQIALSQPIRLDDVVIVENEWGRIEEITSSYVVVRIWDERRMIVPLTYWIEKPFQNWTRQSADLLGTAFLWLDYRTPMAEVRAELERICHTDERWDGRVCVAQVTDTAEHTIQVRLLVSARNSSEAFDLRCAVRERMIDFLLHSHPEALPRLRADISREAVPERPVFERMPEPTSSPGAEIASESPAPANADADASPAKPAAGSL